MRRVRQLIREEMHGFGFQPRLMLLRLLAWPLPEPACPRLRATLLRIAGFKIGSGTLFGGMPVMTGAGDVRRRLYFGEQCLIQMGLRLDVGDTITICDQVGIGHESLFITSTHDLGSPERRVGPLKAAPIIVEQGVWLGARCVVLPGVTIGRGAVVAAGAVVNRDVPPDTLVGGVPAKVLRELPGHDRENLRAVVSPLGKVSPRAVINTAGKAGRTEI